MSVRKFAFLLFALSLTLFITGCKEGSNLPHLPDNSPVISEIKPDTLLSKMATVITINGKNFNENSSVVVENKTIPTTFISSTELQAMINEDITNIPTDISSKKIYIRINNQDSVSGRFPIIISHTPSCPSSKLILDGEGANERKELNLFYFKNGTLIVTYKEQISQTSYEYQNKLIVSKDEGENWGNPKDYSGELLNINEELYRIYDLKLYKSNDDGDSWEEVAQCPTLIPPKNESFILRYLKWAGDSNFYCVYTTSTPEKVINIYTYYSTDFGSSWQFQRKFSYNVSDLYEGEGLSPSGILVNNNGGIRIEFLTWSGRDEVGIAFVSSDRGVHYTQTYGEYIDVGDCYLSNDNSFFGVYQEYYTGAVIGEWFFYRTNLGLNYQYAQDLWEVFERDESMPYLNINMPDRMIVSLGNKMSASFDFGKNWISPESFYEPASDNSMIRPLILNNGSCFVVEITHKGKIYFSKALRE